MGLSASQARLLSITQRLNNNELESQIIAMQKMHLSDRSTAACDKYVNALDATKLDYISYNDTGIQEAVAFTFNSMNQYTPLKNQYALLNNENQIYVSSKDAQNFENSSSLYEFLDKYGLFDRGRAEWETQNALDNEDLANWLIEEQEFIEAQRKFNDKTSQEWIDYYNDKNTYENTAWANYYSSQEYQDYLAELEIYTEASTAGSPYNIWTGIVGTYDNPQSCYSNAIGNPLGNCYIHVLEYLLREPNTDAQNFTTSTGKSVETLYSDISGSAIKSDGLDAQFPQLQELIARQNASGKYIIKCDGDDDLDTEGKQNSLQTIIDAEGTPTELEQLLSDYIYDSTTNTATKVKSLHQKAIDMMYLIKKQDDYKPELTADIMLKLLKNFTDGDMKNLCTTPTPPEEPGPYTGPEPIFDKTLRDRPIAKDYKDKIYDKSLAQWYTNLWHIMDGNADSDEIYTVYDEQAEFDYFTVPNQDKTSTYYNESKNYIVMEDANAGDASWLQFALNNGLVTLTQASFKNNINSSSISWEGIEVSSTSDIREVQDTSKIAKAEAEYKSSLSAIQAEDKKFDAEIKKLDTEHSAFLKEIESIKGVMQKNTEKSFNAFS